jgi:hypothetical protein
MCEFRVKQLFDNNNAPDMPASDSSAIVKKRRKSIFQIGVHQGSLFAQAAMMAIARTVSAVLSPDRATLALHVRRIATDFRCCYPGFEGVDRILCADGKPIIKSPVCAWIGTTCPICHQSSSDSRSGPVSAGACFLYF